MVQMRLRFRHRLILAFLCSAATFLVGFDVLFPHTGIMRRVEEALPLDYYNGTVPRIAVAIKTSQSSMNWYLKAQLETNLAHIKDILLLGDGGSTKVETFMNHTVLDVYTRLHNRLLQLTEVEDEMVGYRGVDKDLLLVKGDADFDKNNHLRRRGTANPKVVEPHKALPGLQELGRRFPKADWYLVMNDDSFVVWDNLYELLSRRRADRAYYLGMSVSWTNCDGVTRMGDGPRIALGRSGILVSRAAMKKLLTKSETCIMKYMDCWGGDIRVGLCFRDLGIKVEGIDGFVMDSFNVHPCKKPYIIGHFEEEEIRLLSDAIRSSPKKVTDTMGDIFQAMYRNTPRLRRQDIDRSGGDFADFPSADPQQCEDVCLTYKECMSWVHVSGKCLLKIGPMLTRRAEGFKSGAIVERYQCKKEKNK